MREASSFFRRKEQRLAGATLVATPKINSFPMIVSIWSGLSFACPVLPFSNSTAMRILSDMPDLNCSSASSLK